MTYLIFYHIKFLDFKKIILKTLGAKCSTSELCFSTGRSSYKQSEDESALKCTRMESLGIFRLLLIESIFSILKPLP